MKGILHIICTVLLAFTFIQKVKAQNSSVLSSGSWYKLAILEDGPYKIDNTLLEEMGIDLEGLDPKKIAIYGNAYNGILPQSNEADRPVDLIENSIFVKGQSDGKFDANDFILFYGKSPNHLSYSQSTNQFQFEKNPYTDTAFYFLTIKDTNGLRTPTVATIVDENIATTRTYQKLEIHELEENSIVDSGREWYGERFNSSNKSHSISFDTDEIVNESDIQVFTSLLSGSSSSSSFDLEANGSKLGTIQMTPVSTNKYTPRADTQSDTFTISSSSVNVSNGLNLNFKFNNESISEGYIDYVYVQLQKKLDLNQGSIQWFRSNSSGTQAFELSGGSSTTRIWDISSPTSVSNIQVEESNGTVLFESENESTSYVAFNEGQELSPIFIKKINNQNLHGLPAADGIIITHPNFLPSANRLAEFRLAFDGMQVEVVTVDQVFNEFSSGMQDVSALRDFIKFQYDKYDQLKYVLLFGDCSFDYKNRSIDMTNYVPVYESRNSLDPLESFSSDDYFGFMSDDEGEWVETEAGDHTMELGIGRIPIQTNEAGEAVVNKIIRYQTNPLGYGKWRNKITFIADDGDSNIHQMDADKMSKYVDTTRQELNINKVYLDAYVQTQNKSPQASDAFLSALSDGNLIVNFTGHGNEGQLTGEDIFNELMIDDLSNNLLMSLFVTATCQFGNYDYPNRVSGGEQMVLLPYGGSIALITAARPVYANTNYKLNEAFYFSAMQKVGGKFKRLGDMIKETKNNSLVGPGNRNYALLGDPMMRISFPEQTVKLTAINGKTLDELDTLKAFGKYTISGEIQTNETLDSKFDGVVTLTAYDKPTKFQTRGDQSTKQTFEIRDVLLFQGKATVSEGQFEIDFIVPKNINYSFGEGKLSFYAINNLSTSDAHGAFAEVIVGGSEKVTNPDRSEPEISIFLNDSTFQSGQTVGPSPLLLVHLKDESGINISNIGFGNELLLYLNDNEPVPLNEYYEASLDTYQEGWIAYPLEDLEPGRYELSIEASDIHNNVATEQIEFFITKENGIKLTNVISYPNPILPDVDQTTVRFDHDRLGEDLVAYLTLTDMRGQEIYTQTYRFDNVSNHSLELVWNLNTIGITGVRKGIYIYQLKVQSRVDGSSGEVFRRIVIMN
ncbi:MAG: type IX secretion system sortase PorU [Reichenbachiella sp.]|uniref:type IX secretion system sortase PorU n=1 Tax=Reichenbachiella sp. TaxID=2184521 RepID=UPI0032990C1B